MVSDTRRLSDVEWFRDVYGDVVQTVRVVATEETRKRRNWVFVTGEQVRGSFPKFDTKTGVAPWAQPPVPKQEALDQAPQLQGVRP